MKILALLLTTLSIAAQVDKPTQAVLDYCNALAAANLLGHDQLARLAESVTLANPFTKEDSYASADIQVHYKNFELMLAASTKQQVDMHCISAWAQEKLAELAGHEKTKKEAHEETREVHRPMTFVRLTDEVEIMDAPVTQWQWFEVTGKNPVEVEDGVETEMANGIKLIPHEPMVNVSYQDIQQFLKELNNSDQEYTYGLPSAEDYRELTGRTRKKSKYLLLDNKRLWHEQNLYELTKESNAEETKLTIYLSSLLNQELLNNDDASITVKVGLRLMRIKQKNEHPPVARLSTAEVEHLWFYNNNQQTLISCNASLQCMIDHAQQYPALQHTLKILSKEGNQLFTKTILGLNFKDITNIVPLQNLTNLTLLHLLGNQITNIAPLQNLTKLTDLDLWHNQITDISPLQHLSNLEVLDLSFNQITNISALQYLTNLEKLYFENNPIPPEQIEWLKQQLPNTEIIA